jgi:hypothetical protein
VGLHVLETHSPGCGHRRECATLIHDEIFDLARRRSHLATSEPNEVGKGRVRAHRYAVLLSQRDGLPHHAGIARVKAAGDAGGGDRGHQ